MKDPVRRLAILTDALTQLRRENCTVVDGNPVSILPTFILEVLYALKWGGATDLPSLTDADAVKIDMDTAYLTITLLVDNRQLKIETTWKQNGKSFTIHVKADGDEYDKPLSFINEREKIRRSVDVLTEVVTKCVKGRLEDKQKK